MTDIASFESLIASTNNYQRKIYEVWSHFIVYIKKETTVNALFFYCENVIPHFSLLVCSIFLY